LLPSHEKPRNLARLKDKNSSQKAEKEMRFIKSFVREEEGAEVVEWALLVVVIGLAVVGAGPQLTDMLSDALSNIGGKTNTQAGSFNS